MQKIMNNKLLIFISILMVFGLILTGCNWFSNGIINILDPAVQLRVVFNPEEADEPEEGCFNVSVYTMNKVEFTVTGFEFKYNGVDYQTGNMSLDALSRTINATYPILPSGVTGSPGEKTIIENIPYLFQNVTDYVATNPFLTEVKCDVSIIGEDGAGNQIEKEVFSSMPIIESGIDFYPPTAIITTSPAAIQETVTGYRPFTVIFDASNSTDALFDDEDNLIHPGSGIIDVNWDFGDGETSTSITTNHTYQNSGDYVAILELTDFYGNIGTALVNIRVKEPKPPEAVIIAKYDEECCPPLTVSFDGSDSKANDDAELGNKIETYSWNFGDPDSNDNTSNLIADTHTYEKAGTYIATLTVTDSNGNTDQAIETIKVGSGEFGAQISTTPDPATGKIDLTVAFDASGSTVQAPPIVSYEWDLNGNGVFTDPEDATGIFATNTYEEVGTFIVGLKVTDSDANEYYDFVSIIAETN